MSLKHPRREFKTKTVGLKYAGTFVPSNSRILCKMLLGGFGVVFIFVMLLITLEYVIIGHN